MGDQNVVDRWDNLPTQREIIELCCYVLRDGFKIHTPRLDAPGSFFHIQLKTFDKFPHTVYAFSLGRIRDAWLCLEEETGRYYFSYPMWRIPKGERRYINEDILWDRIHWLETWGF